MYNLDQIHWILFIGVYLKIKISFEFSMIFWNLPEIISSINITQRNMHKTK